MPPPSLPGYDEALQRVVDSAPELGCRSVPLSEALGGILRQDVVADRDQPPFDRSTMDGFAVPSSSLGTARWPIRGSVAAGAALNSQCCALEPGAVMRIATGAPLPRGADAVIPIEQATVDPDGDGDAATFSVESVASWTNVHRRAADARHGQVVLRAGTRLGPHHLAVAATVGATTLKVAVAPRVALLTTGDELRPTDVPTEHLEPQQIRNSNGPMMAAFLRAAGAEVVMQRHVLDEADQTVAAAADTLTQAHCVVTTGGVSAGQRDRLPDAWRSLGCRTVLHGVAIRPGKPLLVVTAPAGDPATVVLGLPGNPVSVLATAHLFVWPVLLRMMGADTDRTAPRWRQVALTEAVDTQSRREVFRAARLRGLSRAEVVTWHGSGDLMHTAQADGFVRLPQQDGSVPRETQVPFLPFICGAAAPRMRCED